MRMLSQRLSRPLVRTCNESRDYRPVILFLCLLALPHSTLQDSRCCLRLGARSQQHLVVGGADGEGNNGDVSTASDAGLSV